MRKEGNKLLLLTFCVGELVWPRGTEVKMRKEGKKLLLFDVLYGLPST
jgi:hypothetical protein